MDGGAAALERWQHHAAPRASVIVPATGTASALAACRASVEQAAASIRCSVEVVVPAEERSLAAARNAGAAAAGGSVLVFVDGCARMARTTFREIEQHLATGTCVGGAATVVPERHSVGIDLTLGLIRLVERVSGIGSGILWCRRSDFDAVGGFDEHAADSAADFARWLRAHGRRTGRRFVTLRHSPAVTPCASFDQRGDWHLLGALHLPEGAPRSSGTTVPSASPSA